MSEEFTVAGHDLEGFATDWFENLKNGGGQMRGLLDEGGDMSTAFLMANIASRAAEPSASEEELLLFAVLGVAQDYMMKNKKEALLDDWDERWDYVCAAFNHVTEIGDKESALVLAKSAMRGLQDDTGAWAVMGNRFWAKRTVAERADHERLMASIKHRELRAAKLLDPDIDLDALMLSMPLNDEADD